jgi:hypothetical protein
MAPPRTCSASSRSDSSSLILLDESPPSPTLETAEERDAVIISVSNNDRPAAVHSTLFYDSGRIVHIQVRHLLPTNLVAFK